MRFSLYLLTLLVVTALPVSGQGPAPYVASNPVLASRSPLYVQPIVPTGKGWRVAAVLDYANAIETATAPDRRTYLLDAELSQLDLWVGHDLGEAWFGFVNLPLRGVHDGMLDSFLNGYHDLIGLPVPARNRRPKDSYAWRVQLPDRSLDIPRPDGPFLGDLRLGVGRRIDRVQVVLSTTLPTATSGGGEWSRGTIGVALQLGARLVTTPRIQMEAAVMAGATPRHGDLAEYQRTAFVGASAGLRWRVIGQQAIYGTAVVQSANWRSTGLSAMESAEATLDTGFLLKPGSGWPTIQLGLSEDLVPRGPAVDVAARIGVIWN